MGNKVSTWSKEKVVASVLSSIALGLSTMLVGACTSTWSAALRTVMVEVVVPSTPRRRDAILAALWRFSPSLYKQGGRGSLARDVLGNAVYAFALPGRGVWGFVKLPPMVLSDDTGAFYEYQAAVNAMTANIGVSSTASVFGGFGSATVSGTTDSLAMPTSASASSSGITFYVPKKHLRDLQTFLTETEPPSVEVLTVPHTRREFVALKLFINTWGIALSDATQRGQRSQTVAKYCLEDDIDTGASRTRPKKTRDHSDPGLVTDRCYGKTEGGTIIPKLNQGVYVCQLAQGVVAYATITSENKYNRDLLKEMEYSEVRLVLASDKASLSLPSSPATYSSPPLSLAAAEGTSTSSLPTPPHDEDVNASEALQLAKMYGAGSLGSNVLKLSKAVKDIWLAYRHKVASYGQDDMDDDDGLGNGVRQSMLPYITVNVFQKTKYGDYAWAPDGAAAQGREFRSVFAPAGVLEDIVSDMTAFLQDGDWYRSMHVPYRRGYLFWGPPGTGKTTCARALATYFGMSLSVVSADNLTTDSVLQTCFTTVPADSILLLEDVDLLLAAASKNAGKSKNPFAGFGGAAADLGAVFSGTSLSMSGVLNALDGITATMGRMVIMTTNDLAAMHAAILRAGRCDRVYEFGYATRDQAAGMFKWFYPDAAATALVDTFLTGMQPVLEEGVVPARIQEHIVRNKHNATVAATDLQPLLEDVKADARRRAEAAAAAAAEAAAATPKASATAQPQPLAANAMAHVGSGTGLTAGAVPPAQSQADIVAVAPAMSTSTSTSTALSSLATTDASQIVNMLLSADSMGLFAGLINSPAIRGAVSTAMAHMGGDATSAGAATMTTSLSQCVVETEPETPRPDVAVAINEGLTAAAATGTVTEGSTTVQFLPEGAKAGTA